MLEFKKSRLKYICYSFNSNISTDKLKEDALYQVFGAAGTIGYSPNYRLSREYLGIVKDGAGIGRINKYPAKSSLLGTMAYILPKNNIDLSWLKYCIESLDLGISLDKTTIPHIYFSEYGNRTIFCPPLKVQKSIASFLDSKCSEIDALYADIEKQIEILEEYKKSVITETVTKGLNPDVEMKDSGVDWIGSVPSQWNIMRGKYILEYMQKPVRKDDGVITCFRDGEVTLRNNRREDGFTMADKEIGYQGIDVGDLVVHGMDGFAGAIGISDSRGKGSPVLNVLNTQENKKYIMYYLRSMAYSDVFLAHATGIRIRSCDLRWNKLAELLYPVPPVKEQNEIVAYIDSVIQKANDVISDKKMQLETLTEYKKSLIYEYVTGKKEV